MARSARLDALGVVHHVIIRGIERWKIFRDNKNRNDMLRYLSGLLPATYYSLPAYDAFRAAAEVLVNSPSDISIEDLRNGIFSEFEYCQRATGQRKLIISGRQKPTAIHASGNKLIAENGNE